jgi:proteasome lid subunit RPN8/RPN11
MPVYFTTSSRPLRITYDAATAIRRECEKWNGECETGGALRINRDGKPTIIEATVNATSREVGSVTLDRARILSNAAQAREWPLARIGVSTWHTHPGGTTDPSPDDVKSWARLLDESRSDELFELIVTKHKDGWWRTPCFHAFRVARGHKPSGVECLRVERLDVEPCR